MQNARRGRWTIAAGAAIAALTLAACSGGTPETPGAEGSGDSVPFGASIQEWQEAFEDVEPITVVTQVQGGPGSPNAAPGEAYWASVEEYSGGKIKADLAYSYALVAATEADKGIAEGRIDMGNTLPTFNAAAWPAYNGMDDLGYLASPNALMSIFHLNAWQLEVGFETPEILAEYESNGSVALWTANSVPPTNLYCSSPRTSLADLQQAQTIASSAAQATQISEIGMIPVSLPPVEAYEALQRGVLDCVSGSLSSALTNGNFEVANHLLESSEVALVTTSGGYGVNSDFWAGLPLVAQQLLFDRIGVYFSVQSETNVATLVEAAETLNRLGGEVHKLDGETEARMRAANEIIADRVRASTDFDGAELVARAEASAEKWLDLLVTKVGIPADVALLDVDDWLSENEIDYQAYVDALYEEFLLKFRPGS